MYLFDIVYSSTMQNEQEESPHSRRQSKSRPLLVSYSSSSSSSLLTTVSSISIPSKKQYDDQASRHYDKLRLQRDLDNFFGDYRSVDNYDEVLNPVLPSYSPAVPRHKSRSIGKNNGHLFLDYIMMIDDPGAAFEETIRIDGRDVVEDVALFHFDTSPSSSNHDQHDACLTKIVHDDHQERPRPVLVSTFLEEREEHQVSASELLDSLMVEDDDSYYDHDQLSMSSSIKDFFTLNDKTTPHEEEHHDHHPEVTF